MTEPADAFAWDFADEHLLVLLAHLPTQQLLRCARASRQFRAIAGELMRRGLSPGSACHAHWAAGTVEWAAGEALAVARGEVEDLSSEGPRRRKAGASAAAKASIVGHLDSEKNVRCGLLQSCAAHRRWHGTPKRMYVQALDVRLMTALQVLQGPCPANAHPRGWGSLARNPIPIIRPAGCAS